jgi:hypothetical protein
VLNSTVVTFAMTRTGQLFSKIRRPH